MASLDEQFGLFSKFGDTKSDGKTITLTQIDKWFKQAAIFDKKLTTTDTAIAFNKFKSKTINYAEFVKFLEDLANSKNSDVEELKSKLTKSGQPGTCATKCVSGGAVDRLTDSSKYTGAHKQRFDADGKGLGKEGREDIDDNDGYVSGYQNKDTYDKKN